MRIAFAYGIISGGGCERRMGELMRWLLRNGDECWLLASGVNDLGQTMLLGQCGVPRDRLIFMEPGGVYEQFLTDTAAELQADLFDIQWTYCLPSEFRIPAVFTMHGVTQPIPEAIPWGGIICVEDLPDHHLAYHLAATEIIYNWVDLKKFRFQKELGEGACFLGRVFKAVNVRKVCGADPSISIDCYGTVHAHGELAGLPENARWLGYTRPEETLYRYRVVFAAAIAAMEAAAAGRLVIVGSSGAAYADRPAYGHLVRPELLRVLSRDQWAAIRWPLDAQESTAEEVLAEYRQAMDSDWTRERRAIRGYLEQHHDMERQCRKVRQFYSQVLERSGTPA